MKKIATLLLIALILLSSSACGSAEEGGRTAAKTDKTNVSGRNTESEISEAAEGPERERGLTLLCDGSSSFSNHFGTEEGFYYFTEPNVIAEGLSGCRLMYIDYAARQEVYLCSDSGCRHNSESCSSVFSQPEFGADSLVFVHEGSLYVLSREYDQDGSQMLDLTGASSPSVESASAVLYRMGLDGSSRQKIFTFPDNTTTENMVFSDGGDLWFVTKNLSFEQEGNNVYASSANRALSKYDVSEGKITETISLSFDDSMFYKVIGASDTKFVLCGTAYPGGMSEAEAGRLSDEEWKQAFSGSEIVGSTLDKNSREKSEIFRMPNKLMRSMTGIVRDGVLFASNCESGGIFRLDLNTNEKTVLSSLSQDYIFFALDGVLCCWDSGSGSDHTLYFVDMETGETRPCTLTNKSLGWPLDIMAVSGDQALVIYDYEAEPHGDGSYEITKYQYGLISEADLAAGVDRFEPIAMAGKGR
jgi:hypothetical protein